MFALINFDLLIIIALLIGGDAASGYSRLSHFYLRMGFLTTEVSYSVFNYSLIHFYSFFAVTLPLWVASEFAWLYFNLRLKFSPDNDKKTKL